MELSVIIPTYNRAEILEKCLAALTLQDFPGSEVEVLVIDDGSQDETAKVVYEWQKAFPFKLKYFFQRNQGQGSARNLGINEAQGEIIILIGDDIIPAPDFLKEHAKAHKEHPKENDAILGLILWHPELTVTPLMEFMTRGGALFGKYGGHQFAYDRIKGKEKVDFNYFYTSNISLKRSLLLDFKFDPYFSSYGWEDIELGYRLTKRAALNLWYTPVALGYHFHPMTDEDFTFRMRAIGRSAHLIHKKYPELKKVPGLKKTLFLKTLSSRLSLSLLSFLKGTRQKFLQDLYYYALSKKYFFEGLRLGYNERGSFEVRSDRARPARAGTPREGGWHPKERSD